MKKKIVMKMFMKKKVKEKITKVVAEKKSFIKNLLIIYLSFIKNHLWRFGDLIAMAAWYLTFFRDTEQNSYIMGFKNIIVKDWKVLYLFVKNSNFSNSVTFEGMRALEPDPGDLAGFPWVLIKGQAW